MRLPRRLFVPCLLLALACAPVAARPAQYALDPVHTRVMLDIEHAGLSKAIGTVSGSQGTLVFDPADWSSARVEVSVPLARVDFGDDRWNRAVRARNLLDTERHPAATFVSNRIEPRDATHAIVHGTLTLRGVSREVALDATFNAARRHPMPPFRRMVGFSATTQLSRADFGIDAWPSMIGDTVGLRIELEAVRERGTGRDDADDADDTAVGTDTPGDETP
ncbi:YceI family protein [Luteimonas sp. RC10]|uniref:YceI family protein n=1 Tax=Luteimonas sp. RC10 TaxID=2587035 RepID=UPI001620CBC2|nr:YceI family protein [Luteimonas sp. RC10]MBB3344996.1 polyisoprenoid-binding protein YceI [Luteimonas sp. RC10]